MQQGQSWVDNITVNCNDSSTNGSHIQNWTFVGMETVTVPAGTFNAHKFQTVGTDYSNQNGSYFYNATTWLDSSSAYSRMVKDFTQYIYAGNTTPGGTLSTVERDLASHR